MKNCGMPLAEFLRMSADPSCRPDNDFMELVWENGQIMMQGQSNKPKKSNLSNNFQTKPQEGDNRNSNSSKLARFDMVDFELPVPCSEMSVDHDDDMVPWLNYGMEDNYGFLHELSGVSMNDISTENHLACREKKSMDNGMSFKHKRGGISEVPQFLPHFQHNIPIVGSSEVTANNNGTSCHITSQDSIHNPSSLCAFTSLRLQKLDARQPTFSPAFTNFPCISRHLRPHRLPDKASNTPENNDKRNALGRNNRAESAFVNPSTACSQKEIVTHNHQSVLNPVVNGGLESFPKNPIEKVLSPNQAKCTEDAAKNDALQNAAHCETAAKAGERNLEPLVAASSVCSVNSVEGAPNESVRDLKRKSHDTGDSEDPSEEVEEDSVGARKAPLIRSGSKRTRAAEVHNLSERRRRDRINEKMRALQELIPNCNKVDKASMLDEAIEYLKTLQLQVQMMSMGPGFYMQPMMLPPGIQAIQGAHMPHFSPMGVGMGMGMGFGFNMLDMNNSMKMIPFQGSPYALPSTPPAFHGMPSSCLQAFGHPGQGLPIPMQRPPVLPPSFNIPVGLNVSGVPGSSNAAPLAPSFYPKDVGQQMLPTNNVESSMNQASSNQNPWKLTREGIWNPPPCHDQAQAQAQA